MLSRPHATQRHPAAPSLWGPAASICWQLVSLVLAVVVTTLALMPSPPQEVSLGWDKLNHTAAFCALAVVWRLAFPGNAWRWVQLAAGLMALGVAIEVAQLFVPGRQADAADLLADALGAAVGMLVAAALEWLLRRRMSPPSRPSTG